MIIATYLQASKGSLGQYPNLIINVLEDTEYMESLSAKFLNIKTEVAMLAPPQR